MSTSSEAPAELPHFPTPFVLVDYQDTGRGCTFRAVAESQSKNTQMLLTTQNEVVTVYLCVPAVYCIIFVAVLLWSLFCASSLGEVRPTGGEGVPGAEGSGTFRGSTHATRCITPGPSLVGAPHECMTPTTSTQNERQELGIHVNN